MTKLHGYKNLKAPRAHYSARHPKRPIHRRVLLHPVSILLVLCTGVLVATTTFHSYALSYDVTAIVPAEPVTNPAIITAPTSQQHVSTPLVTVAGTCPDQAYIKLFRNNILSSIASCQGSTFLVHAHLDVGVNQLQAKVYNLTDNEGPPSPPVIVHYDVTTVTAQKPAEVPTTLRMATLDTAAYSPHTILPSSPRPTVSGYAPPYSTIVVTFHSKVLTCRTQANGDGWWSCTLDQDLSAGIHSVDIVATTPDRKIITFPTVRISVNLAAASLLTKSSPISPLTLTHNYRHQTRLPGEVWKWDFQISGGTPPYRATIIWGDDSTTTTDPSHETSLGISHVFTKAGNYRPDIQLTDSQGNKATFQLLAPVKTPSSTALPASSIFSDIQSYLWIIWPAYIIILLMIASFWLGEREIIQRVLTRSGYGKRTLHK